MNLFIENKIKSAKVLRVCIIIIFVLWIGSFFIMPHIKFSALYPMVMLLTMGVLICSLIYWLSYHQFMRSIKKLGETGIMDIAGDISLEVPTLPNSKIYCGHKAFLCKKPCVIVPYSEIAWMHLYKRSLYGVVTVEKSVIVYTKDGGKYTLKADADEIQWLLENYIRKNSPNVIIGYGTKQKKEYYQFNPEAVAARNKIKTIWGIVLMLVGALLLVVGLINQTLDGGSICFLSLLIVGGIVLFLLGKKRRRKS